MDALRISLAGLKRLMHHEVISLCEFELGVDIRDARLKMDTYETLYESMAVIAAEQQKQVQFERTGLQRL
jgi:hypothetical protein